MPGSRGPATTRGMNAVLSFAVLVGLAQPPAPALHTEQPLAALDLTLYEVANIVGVNWRLPQEAGAVCRTIVKACGDTVFMA